MSKLLIQDDILNGMDVYVEYTFDRDDESVIFYDYGLELDAETIVKHEDGGRSVIETRQHVSLRGYKNTRWMEEKLEEYITAEHTVEADTL